MRRTHGNGACGSWSPVVMFVSIDSVTSANAIARESGPNEEAAQAPGGNGDADDSARAPRGWRLDFSGEAALRQNSATTIWVLTAATTFRCCRLSQQLILEREVLGASSRGTRRPLHRDTSRKSSGAPTTRAGSSSVRRSGRHTGQTSGACSLDSTRTSAARALRGRGGGPNQSTASTLGARTR